MIDNQEEMYAKRHSLAHILASAVQRIWPHAKFGVGPVVENGFYYDIDLGDIKVSEDDLSLIEKEMKKIIKEKQNFVHSTKSIDEALVWSKNNQQPYKTELLNDLKRAGTTEAKKLNPEDFGTISDNLSNIDEVSFYTNGNFEDLCRGPHVINTSEAGHFKLIRVAGAYWRGIDSNPQMQRIYGVGFQSKVELEEYLQIQEEAKKRDHRKLGVELDLFTFSELVGPGLPLFTPKGTILRNLIGQYSQQLQKSAGYEAVSIPHIAKIDLYKTSGHYDKYPERFTVTSFESSDEFMMKPMNCPHHTQIYDSKPRSYKDLPVRYMENTLIYRDEKTGELHGLSRVRGATQDDGHVFCRPDQIEEEFTSIMNMIKEMYSVFDLKWHARLSFRDSSDKYLGEPQLWEESQKTIESVAKKLNLEYYIGEGEAAFYGPKIDIMATDALGRKWQLATEQLDFVQPSRFNLSYTDADGTKQTPVMIHKALLGSFERFLSVYIEHTNGKFPFWLAPEQLRVLTINDTVMDYVKDLQKMLDKIVSNSPVKYNELRYSIDDRSESLGKKIREALSARVPVLIIIGNRDVENNTVSIRHNDSEQTIAIDQVIDYIQKI